MARPKLEKSMAKHTVMILTRFSEDQVEQINAWRRAQKKIPTMSDAMRVLTKQALEQIMAA